MTHYNPSTTGPGGNENDEPGGALDELLVQVAQLFAFAQTYRVTHDTDSDESATQKNQTKINPPVLKHVSWRNAGPYNRHVTIEEELERKIERITRISDNFKLKYKREKEERSRLQSEIQQCKNNCIELVEHHMEEYVQRNIILEEHVQSLKTDNSQLLKENEILSRNYDENKYNLAKAQSEISIQKREVERLSRENIRLISRESESKSRADVAECANPKCQVIERELNCTKHKWREIESQRDNLQIMNDLYSEKLKLYEKGTDKVKRPVKSRSSSSPRLMRHQLVLDSFDPTKIDIKPVSPTSDSEEFRLGLTPETARRSRSRDGRRDHKQKKVQKSLTVDIASAISSVKSSAERALELGALRRSGSDVNIDLKPANMAKSSSFASITKRRNGLGDIGGSLEKQLMMMKVTRDFT